MFYFSFLFKSDKGIFFNKLHKKLLSMCKKKNVHLYYLKIYYHKQQLELFSLDYNIELIQRNGFLGAKSFRKNSSPKERLSVKGSKIIKTM